MFLDEFDHIIKISIHALREEGDCERYAENKAAYQFQSTPSARRATRMEKILKSNSKFQSTPSARRATTHESYHRRSPS